MRSKIYQQLLDETPEHTKIFVEKYADLVVRIHEILEQKGISQNGLAENLGKKPSEISKWLNGDHNFTLRSIAKLEAELGEALLIVPQNDKFATVQSSVISRKVEQSSKGFYIDIDSLGFQPLQKRQDNSIRKAFAA